MNSSDLSVFSPILNSTSIQYDYTPQLSIPDLSNYHLPSTLLDETPQLPSLNLSDYRLPSISTLLDETPQLSIPNLSDYHLPPTLAYVNPPSDSSSTGSAGIWRPSALSSQGVSTL